MSRASANLPRPDEGTARSGLFELYGLRVQSELPLSAAPAAEGEPDLDVRLGEPHTVSRETVQTNGRLLAEYKMADGRGYRHFEEEDGFRLVFDGICEFFLDRDLRHVRAHLDLDADPELAGILVGGNLTALRLALAGERVLHASAIDVDGQALAFMGASGMGKSTLAALGCAAGAGLITDDLLRLREDEDGFSCYPGSREMRLRAGSQSLAETLAEGSPGRSVDKRFLAEGRVEPTAFPRLRAIVVPKPSREIERLKVVRTPKPQSLYYLLSYPRVSGWRMDGPLGNQFQALAGVARAVPVFEAEVPWGPPFEVAVAEALWQATGITRS